MDTNDYIQRLEDLKNDNTYEQVSKDMNTTITNKVKGLAKRLYNKGMINREIKKYMTLNNPRAGIAKANPTMHKKEIKIRTIIGSINSPTEWLAEINEHELEQWLTNLTTYILLQNTTQFLRKLEELDDIPKNSILFTVDIK